MKRQLENLDTIQVVSVEKDSTLANGAVAWTVTFDTELGDLPMLEVTSGRLTGTHLTLVSRALLRCLPFCLSVGNGMLGYVGVFGTGRQVTSQVGVIQLQVGLPRPL